MKNTTKYIQGAALVGLLALTASTFASDDMQNSMWDHKNHQMMWNKFGSWMSMEHGSWAMHGFISKYLRTDLTDTEKTTLDSLMKAHKEAMMTLMKNNTDNSWSTDMQTQMKTLCEKHVNEMLPYIATDKIEAFKTDIANKSMMPGGMKGGRHWEMKEMKGEWKKNWNTKQNTVLPANINKALDTKLATFSTDAEKITWLNSINSKIDTLITKVTSTKTRNTLNALKDLINEKIDAINGNNVDDSTIENLLK